MTTIYIAGPMSGMPHFNFPAFYAAEDRLRSAGWETIHNPARIDIEKGHVVLDVVDGISLAPGFDVSEVLIDDLRLIQASDAVYFLKGWEASKGAQVEHAYATAIGRRIEYSDHSEVLNPTVHTTGSITINNGGITSLTHGAKAFVPAQPPITPFRDIVSGTTAGTSLADTPWIDVEAETYTMPPTPPRVCTDPDVMGNPVDHDLFPGDAEAFAPAIAAAKMILHEGKQPHMPPQMSELLAPPRNGHDDEVRVTSETGGQKGKKLAQLGALDPVALTELAKVAGMGAEKYDRHNFLRGYDWSLSFDAAMRHLLEGWEHHDIDPESGLSAFAHAAWQCLALVSFQLRQIGTDDRPPSQTD